jgi:hypothetical protein
LKFLKWSCLYLIFTQLYILDSFFRKNLSFPI